MNLDTLIQHLETAAGLATGGEHHASVNEDGAGAWLGVDAEWITGPNGAEMLIDEAQAIAIRHNTAALVISELKAQRARADRAEELNRECAKAYSACFAKIEEAVREALIDPADVPFTFISVTALKGLAALLPMPTPKDPTP